MTTNEFFPAADTSEATDTHEVLETGEATASADATGQMRLLDTSDLPLQFRLDKVTRERGLAHVAELRRQLAQRPKRWAA